MLRKLYHLALVFGVGVLTSSLAEAANPSFYSDAATFQANATISKTIDFENLVGTTDFPANYDSSTGSYIAGQFTIQDVLFRGYSQYGDETYIIGANAVDSSIYQINLGSAALLGGRAVTAFFLNGGAGAGYNAIGFDFGRRGSVDYPDSLLYQVSIVFTDGSTQNIVRLLADGQNQYLGFTSDKDIAIVSINNLFNAYNGPLEPYIALDNVTFGTTVAAVPEPQTYALMLAGLGLVSVAARRRQA